jgi:hypothetical protein
LREEVRRTGNVSHGRRYKIDPKQAAASRAHYNF